MRYEEWNDGQKFGSIQENVRILMIFLVKRTSCQSVLISFTLQIYLYGILLKIRNIDNLII